MQICIAGWYYDSDLLSIMESIHENHPVMIIGHKDGKTHGLPCEVIKNIGLEFHMYNNFLMNYWDKKSNVLFMHDDIKISPIIANYEVISPINIFNHIAKLKVDQGYIFKDFDDAKWNASKHGRMIVMSGRLLSEVKNSGGFWFDENNTGKTTTGPYNSGIVNFHESMIQYNKYFDTCGVFFAPAIELKRRNGDIPVDKNAPYLGGL